MSKFGLEPDEQIGHDDADLAARLAAFPAAAPRHPIDVQAMDAAAAQHGFVSREVTRPTSSEPPQTPSVRRRRIGVPQPTRHLAVRLTARQYDRFVAYADRHELTYHDAIAQLLDTDEQTSK